MAHKKGQSTTMNGRDSQSKRLGVKLFGGQSAIAGNIIVRQLGTKWRPGKNVGLGRDHTIYSVFEGKVTFHTSSGGRVYVSVDPLAPAKAS